MARCEMISALQPLIVRQLLVLGLLNYGQVIISNVGELLPPDFTFINLHFAQTSLSACLLKNVEFFLGRDFIPVDSLVLGEILGFAENLLIALAEQPVDLLRHAANHD